MSEKRANYTPSTTKQAKLAWRRLLSNQHRIPWEMREGDIQAHAAWMEKEGYAVSTIANSLGYISNFYQWCDERRIDPECKPGFNPAAGVKRPRVGRYATAELLSEAEVERLLGITHRDDTALGKWDHAFILARVRLGMPLKAIQRLRCVGRAWGAGMFCIDLSQR